MHGYPVVNCIVRVPAITKTEKPAVTKLSKPKTVKAKPVAQSVLRAKATPAILKDDLTKLKALEKDRGFIV